MAKAPGSRNHRHQIRNIHTTYTTPEVIQAGSAPTTDEQFTARYTEAGIKNPSLTVDQSPAPKTTSFTSPRSRERQHTRIVPRARTRAGQRQKRYSAKTKLPRSRTRATSVTMGIWSWGLFSWLIFQLPFAIINLVFLGIAAAVAALYQAATVVNADDGVVITIGKTVLGVFANITAGINDYVLRQIGIDLSVLDPTNFFLLTYILLFGFALCVLLAIYLVYKLALFEPLDGERSGLKKGMVLLALVGYAIPLLNLFPWFLPWTIVMRKHPS